MSAKHTPGPWQINGSHFYGPDPERILLGHCIAGDSEGANMIANLHLIAAAPMLLEALEYLVTIEDSSLVGNDFHGAIYKAVKQSRAAIASARGDV